MTDKIYEEYSVHGLFFKKEVITNYCISLYSKPFVILSGISGTGKTKIAQLFNPYFPEPAGAKNLVKEKDYIAFNITDGIINGDGRGNFKKEHLKVLLTEDQFEAYEKERKELRAKDVADNFKNTYGITIIDENKMEHVFKFYVQRANSPLVRARFKSKVTDNEPYDLQPYMKSKFRVNDTVILKKVKDKVFEILKSDEVDHTAEAKESVKPNIQNIAFIAVKSDWNDPTGLMGFYNIIDRSYHLGPFLRHLLLAREFPDIPFFVILDEMNLSKVEYYLSDILSVLETRIPNTETGEIDKEEQIVLHSSSDKSGEYLETNDEFFDLIPAKLSIPQNLYITGTVNIDESTYMLSPKVLDRSNVIEFNDVDFDSYIGGEIKETEAEYFKLKSIPDFTKPKVANRRFVRDIGKEKLEVIKSLNMVLEKSNVHFGYRVLNEISLYLHNVLEYIGDDEKTWFKAMDFQILQKILPKLSGSQIKLQSPLIGIISLLSGLTVAVDDPLEKITSLDVDKSHYPKSLAKAVRMYVNLVNQGFTSFIE